MTISEPVLEITKDPQNNLYLYYGYSKSNYIVPMLKALLAKLYSAATVFVHFIYTLLTRSLPFIMGISEMCP